MSSCGARNGVFVSFPEPSGGAFAAAGRPRFEYLLLTFPGRSR